jgi:hypothetical protein
VCAEKGVSLSNRTAKTTYKSTDEQNTERTTGCIRYRGLSGKSEVSDFNKWQFPILSEVHFYLLLLVHSKTLVGIKKSVAKEDFGG